MIYFGNPSTPGVRKAMRDDPRLGAICTPAQHNYIYDTEWCADNGCFGKGYPGDVAYLGWLAEQQPTANLCRFATAPDVIADARATLTRSAPFLPIIRALGFPAALVAQDGLECLPVPWASFDVLFIGGSTAWKLGDHAKSLVHAAKVRGKWAHMGRVNSLKRLRYADEIGCDSVDGTYLIFGPDVNLPKLLGWLDEIDKGHAL